MDDFKNGSYPSEHTSLNHSMLSEANHDLERERESGRGEGDEGEGEGEGEGMVDPQTATRYYYEDNNQESYNEMTFNNNNESMMENDSMVDCIGL